MSKQLSQKEMNKLAIEQQFALVQLTEQALANTYNGASFLFGKEVTQHDLAVAKNKLVELDRQRALLERADELPYARSNGSGEKVKAHFAATGAVKFIVAPEGTTAASVSRHTNSKAFNRKQIKVYNNHQKTSADDNRANIMAQATATKKATSKKAATKASSKKAAPAKKAAAKKAATKKVLPAGHIPAQAFRDAYDKDPKNFNVAEYANKNGVAYGRVYGAIVKHVGGVENIGKAAPKAAAAKKEAPAKKGAKK